jgi:REP element-mobilizing transposase RayT
MILNDAGKIANKCWLGIPEHFPHVTLDEFIIMPNHIHGIIIIEDVNVGANNYSPLQLYY